MKDNNLGKTIKETLKEHGVNFPPFYKDFNNPTNEEKVKWKAYHLTKLLKKVLWSSRVSRMKSVVGSKESTPIKNYRHEPNGKFVKIRPCAEEYNNKTYLGLYIGNVALGFSYNMNDEHQIVMQMDHHNPGIFVFELNKVIYGCESWWGEIGKPEDLKDITDLDINNVWYVQALKSLGGQNVQNN